MTATITRCEHRRMDSEKHPGPERSRFRRLALHYPVSLRALSATDERVVVDGVTENLSFAGALVGVSGATTLPGAEQAAREGDGASAARFVRGLQPYFETVKRELAGFS